MYVCACVRVCVCVWLNLAMSVTQLSGVHSVESLYDTFSRSFKHFEYVYMHKLIPIILNNLTMSCKCITLGFFYWIEVINGSN